MRAFVLPSVVAFGLVLSAAACGVSPGDPQDPARTGPIATGEQSILGGTADNATSNNAVVELFFNSEEGQGACTGTVFKIEGGVSWILTAAHCIHGATEVYIGPNANNPSDQFDSSMAVKDVRYGEGMQTGNYPFDVGVIKVNADMGVTPIELAPEADGLAANAEVTSYGYGSTDFYQSQNFNTQRYAIARNIAGLSATNIVYDQSDHKGICAGDSGGPVVMGSGSARRVAGVHSNVGNPGGQEPCWGEANSVRVSSRYDFIMAVVNGTALPQPSACQTCSTDAETNSVCEQKRQHCFNDAACNALADCLQTTDANTCVTQNPEGVGPLLDFQDCGCTDVCADQCGGDAACSSAAKCGIDLTGAAGAKLTLCAQANCCDESDAASADGKAYVCMNDKTPEASCMDNAKYAAWKACTDAKCPKSGSSSSSGDTTGDDDDTSGDDDDDTSADDDATSSSGAAKKKKTTTTTSGCSVSSAGTVPGGAGFGFLLGAALLARGVRARRRAV